MIFGDLVEYDLRASHGGDIERGYVLGEMSYSENGSHILLGETGKIGMPIGSGHCHIISSGHDAICAPLRAEYERHWPGSLKAP